MCRRLPQRRPGSRAPIRDSEETELKKWKVETPYKGTACVIAWQASENP